MRQCQGKRNSDKYTIKYCCLTIQCHMYRDLGIKGTQTDRYRDLWIELKLCKRHNGLLFMYYSTTYMAETMGRHFGHYMMICS